MNYIGTKLKIIIIAVSGNIQILLFCLALLIGFTGCKNTKETENIATVSQPIGEITLSDIEAAVASQSTKSIKPIDIRSPGFFLMLKPWKKGTLLTMDGRARFAEISFIGKSRIKITHLVDFPRKRIDKILLAAPESGVCVTQSGAVFHVADIITKKTKSIGPFKKWAWYRWGDGSAKVLYPEKGIIRFGYSYKPGRREAVREGYMSDYNIVYDAKNDKVLYESPEKGEALSLDFGFTEELIYSSYRDWLNNDKSEEVLYNWRTREIIRNDLTKTFDKLDFSPDLAPGFNISVKERFILEGARKITWDENYENVKVIPYQHNMFPPKIWAGDFYISADSKWAAGFTDKYKGMYGDYYCKRVFFHLDNCYPNGISMPIFAEDYYASSWNDGGAFVEHPVYGLCFAEEWHKREGGKDKQYLRLYKMDEVLAEINRQLLEVKK